MSKLIVSTNPSVNSAGFSLIELLVVVVILVVLASFAVPLYREQMRTAAQNEAKARMSEVQNKLTTFRARNFTYTLFDLRLEFPSNSNVSENTVNVPINMPATSSRYQIVVSDMTGLALTNASAVNNWRIIAIPNQTNKTYASGYYLLTDSTGFRCKTAKMKLISTSVDCGTGGEVW